MKAPLIEELKARRQTLGCSVKELGERCGIDEKLLCDWECGTDMPRLDEAETWASALGLSLSLDAKPRDSRAGVRIDWDACRITVDGMPVRLTPMEWKALERLARVPGELVTHEALFRHLYGEDRPYRIQSTAIRVLITKLRRLLPLRIEARWGRGYVVSGIEPAPQSDAAAAPAIRSEPPRPAPQPPAPRPTPVPSGRDRIALVPPAATPKPAVREVAPAMRERSEIAYPNLRRVPPAPAPVRPSACRAEELGVIERFLAERGVTRCPDVATIQRSPLPTLVWDKIKRKWVRPPQPDREAS
jgi:transcriptional regulator with XRE-family HTH domain